MISTKILIIPHRTISFVSLVVYGDVKKPLLQLGRGFYDAFWPVFVHILGSCAFVLCGP